MPELNGVSFFSNKKDAFNTKSPETTINKPETEEIFPIKKKEEFVLQGPENIEALETDSEVNNVSSSSSSFQEEQYLSSADEMIEKILQKKESIPVDSKTSDINTESEVNTPSNSETSNNINSNQNYYEELQKIDNIDNALMEQERLIDAKKKAQTDEENEAIDNQLGQFAAWSLESNLFKDDDSRYEFLNPLMEFDAVQEQTVEIRKQGKVSDSLYERFVTNNQSVVFAQNLGLLSQESQERVSKLYLDNAQKTNNKEILKALAEGLKDCDPKVQTKMVKELVQTGDKEIANKAVQSFCESTKLPDNLKAETLHSVIPDLANPMSGGETLEQRFAGGRLTNSEIQQLTASQRSEYFLKIYKTASIEQKVEMLLSKDISSTTRKCILSSLSQGEQRQFYEQMAKTDPDFFENYIKEDARIAERIIKMPEINFDVRKMAIATVERMAKSDKQFKMLYQKLTETTDYTEHDNQRLASAREKHRIHTFS